MISEALDEFNLTRTSRVTFASLLALLGEVTFVSRVLGPKVFTKVLVALPRVPVALPEVPVPVAFSEVPVTLPEESVDSPTMLATDEPCWNASGGSTLLQCLQTALCNVQMRRH